VVETAMPTMITAGAVIMAAGLAPELAAAFVGWGLVLSLLTVPLWAFIVR
jgi:malate permease and related proteins